MLNLLKILDDLITLQMNVKCADIPVNDEILEEWLLIAQVESDKVKREFKSRVLTIEDENQVRQFVNNNYARLVCLSNKLFHTIKRCEEKRRTKNRKILSVKKVVLMLVEEMILYIREVSPQYYNKNQKITEYCKCLLIKKVDSIISSLNPYKYEKIANISLLQIRQSIKLPNAKITFHNSCYLYRLTKIIQEASKENNQSLFTRHLIYLNFNSIDFLDFLVTKIKDQTLKIDTAKGQIEKLYWYLKKTNQVRVKLGYIFNTKQKGVKEFITDWILEEIIFLEKKLTLSGRCAQDLQVSESGFKISTGFSVAQIACFLKLLTDTGAIQNRNKKELINFIALNVQSKKQENISPDSLRSKFYNIEESARLEIKNLIIQLLNQINHYGLKVP